MTIAPPGLSDFSECDQVASPTVSITASTRSGSRAPDAKASCAPSSQRRAPAWPRCGPSRTPAGRPPGPSRCTPWPRRRWRPAPARSGPGRSRTARTASGRRSATPSTGRPPRRSDSSAGLGTTLRSGTMTYSASVPWCFSDSSVRPGSSVSSPRPALGVDHRVHDDLVAGRLVDAGGVAAEDHRQLLGLDADAAQRPQVVVVQARGLAPRRASSRRRARARGARRPPGRPADRRG